MPTVMLLEDDAVMRSLLTTLLEIEGFGVTKPQDVSSPDQILEDVRRVRPDLLLVDVHLGPLNGFDLLARLRADEQLKPIRVVMSSGMDLARRCNEAGANGFIMKPYMPDDFLKYIRTILGN